MNFWKYPNLGFWLEWKFLDLKREYPENSISVNLNNTPMIGIHRPGKKLKIFNFTERSS